MKDTISGAGRAEMANVSNADVGERTVG